MSMDHVFREPDETDSFEVYVPPRSFTQHYGTPPVLGILETDRSDLTYFEKAIREKYKKIMDICSANNMPETFCESAADAIRRIYLRAQRLSRAVSEVSKTDGSLLERFSRFRRAFERSISITDQVASPKAIAVVAALIMARSYIGAPGNHEREIQRFFTCISNRFTQSFKSEMQINIKRYDENIRRLLREMESLESELKHRASVSSERRM